MERLEFLFLSDVGRAVWGVFFEGLDPGVFSNVNEGSFLIQGFRVSLKKPSGLNGIVCLRGEKEAREVFEGGHSLMI